MRRPGSSCPAPHMVRDRDPLLGPPVPKKGAGLGPAPSIPLLMEEEPLKGIFTLLGPATPRGAGSKGPSLECGTQGASQARSQYQLLHKNPQ